MATERFEVALSHKSAEDFMREFRASLQEFGFIL
jgi:hypothetical protein